MKAYILMTDQTPLIVGIFLKESEATRFLKPGLHIESTEISTPNNAEVSSIVYRVFPSDYYFSTYEDALKYQKQEKIPDSYIVSQVIYKFS